MKIFTINLLIILFTLTSCTENKYKNFEIDGDLLTFLKSNDPANSFIAHSGGGIDGKIYTNSLEAINQSISNGFKMIEIDLLVTSDNYYIGGHYNWSSFKKKLSMKDKNDEALSLADVKKKKVFGKYSPILIDQINDIFSDNTNLYLVTDKDNNFNKMLSDFKFDNKRLIVEVFGRENYFLSIDQGIKNPLFNATVSDFDFILDNNIKLISVHQNELIKNKKKFRKLRDKGTFIFTYTSNEKKFINDYIDEYFDAIYTDFWNINLNKCINTECITY